MIYVRPVWGAKPPTQFRHRWAEMSHKTDSKPHQMGCLYQVDINYYSVHKTEIEYKIKTSMHD